jgi:hypothetical protein
VTSCLIPNPKKMKKKILVIIVLAIFCLYLYHDYNKFYSRLDSIIELGSSATYSGIIFDHYERYGEFPKKLESIFKVATTVDEEHFYKSVFNDPFAENSVLEYIPIQSNTGLTIGFVLLSRGPNGVSNNSLIPYISSSFNSLKSLKLMNKGIYNELSSKRHLGLSYNPLTSFIHKTDLLVSHFTLDEYYSTDINSKIENREIVNNSKLIDEVLNYNLHLEPKYSLLKSWMPIFTDSESDDLSWIGSDTLILSNEGRYKVTCFFYNSALPDPDPSLYIVAGLLDSISYNTNEFFFRNCFYILKNPNNNID